MKCAFRARPYENRRAAGATASANLGAASTRVVGM